ncbi:MAG: alanine racemase [Clostridia bacterium]|nr:alanine racemase [Clostridia bacterium]
MQVENARTRVWAEINLDALAKNTQAFCTLLSKPTKLMAVVKANAYGHGTLCVAKTVLENGADCLGVATAEEALALRTEGISAPILILGITNSLYAEELVLKDITLTVSSYHQAKVISEAAGKIGKTALLHLAVDTGMSRIGFGTDESAVQEIIEISKLANLTIEGMFTHFSKADEEDKSYTKLQFSRFMELSEKLSAQGIKIPVRHVCNSAATIEFPEYHLDMVRVGISLYGCYPSEEVDHQKLALLPVMTLKSRIVNIAAKPKGTLVSYGGTYETEKEARIATVSVGYADGYKRTLSNRAEMIVDGEKVPVIGRICMDQCMIDVTDVHNIDVGDEVILFGKGGGQEITPAYLAGLIDTIDYELLCTIGARVARVYLKDGTVFV